MYVDESGDTGTTNSPTRYFILSALIIHEGNWQNFLDDLIVFRRAIKSRYGLLLKEEIHASEFLRKSMRFRNPISRNNRLDLLKKCLDWLNIKNEISIITIRVDKNGRPDPFDFAWRALIQRFDNTLTYRNFPGGTNGNDKGMIICDNTDGNKLTKLLRQMRRFNQVSNSVSFGIGSRNIPLRAIIEDPFFKDSKSTFILQMIDVIAYFARQVYEPNKYVRQKGARGFYGRIINVINTKVTKYNTPFKIVEI